MSIYIGIDPGKKGAISGIFNNEQIVSAMMSTESLIKHQLCSIARWYDFTPTREPKFGWIGQEPVKAIIEAVHAFPGQGVTSMFTFGQNYGFLRGCLVALEISFIEVTPQKWMAYFGLKKDKEEAGTDYKKRILQKAQNLFPNSNVTLQTADSLMLCEYLKQTNRS